MSVQEHQKEAVFVGSFRFQYILCVGSSLQKTLELEKEDRFNTSYVSVQVTLIVLESCRFSCFNTSYVSVQENIDYCKTPANEFQYILCVGSRLSK